MPFTFKVGAKIKEAWPLYKENFGNIILFVIVLAIIQTISSVLSGKDGNAFVSLVFFIINTFFLYLGIKANLNLLDSKGFHPFSREVLPTWPLFWNFFKTYLLLILCILPIIIIPMFIVIAISILPSLLLGVVFLPYLIPVIAILIIPGMYIASRLFPSIYMSIDKGQGAVMSIKGAWEITKGYGWYIFWKTFVIGLFAVVGIFALFIGIVVTYPIAMIVIVMLYRELVKSSVVGPTPVATVVNPVVPEVVETPKEEVK
ncbi:hypothetical protein A2467_01265 [Candidatus Nomurabacteria bacterium RIFOXYC2_FULL_36_8]|nr:MAG: hypothetical protein UR97_C0002G0045 [Candidatus Nomurabacteria bacterium GW2011_GWE2_36_115]KKP94450.1 MAG: hypothetical protein US00_C0001G0044 [Candidatus Nomurabacteria bacterium GW2011_GWF2_36_126]KKP96912.1 MAG: hypothetical protein US04_C0001G0415 [Candidatus Nomurabacteria bacterium GW2011_GWD2_36_14]KKP99484.1 MAG: hypothetical protein US08_C0001G0166 [Candidatus Nomurabacteria bacterium GW2011_GWF2_36_19]KKQ05660.1 MAG: hypothetical protein US17_C0002G0044 [Candidatus Nomuraba